MKSLRSPFTWALILLILLISVGIDVHGQKPNPAPTSQRQRSNLISPVQLDSDRHTVEPGTQQPPSVTQLTPEIPMEESCSGEFNVNLEGIGEAELCAEYSINIPRDAELLFLELEFDTSGRNLHFGINFDGPVSERGFRTYEEFANPSEYSSIVSRLERPSLQTGTLYIGVFNFEERRQNYSFTVSLSPVSLQIGAPYEGSITGSSLGGRSPGPGRWWDIVDYVIRVPSAEGTLRVRLENHDSGGDIDLAVRAEQPVQIVEGELLTDFVSEGREGIELAEITPQSSPPLRSGVYFIKVGNVEAERQRYTLTATFEPREAEQPPEADFTFSPQSPTTDDTVQFTDRSSDPDGEIVSWQWNFGDEATSTQRNPTHRYSQPATYTVTLQVTDDDGLSSTASKTITVEESLRPPQAPTNLQATAHATNAIRLQWQDNSEVEEGFVINRRQADGEWEEIAEVPLDTTQYDDTEVSPGSEYCYQVTAYNEAGTSPPSNESCAVAPVSQSPLQVVPQSLRFSAQAGGPNPDAQSLTLRNRGDQAVEWEASTEGSWLFINFRAGTLQAQESVELQASVDLTGLTAGTHTGSITFSAPRNPEISPVSIPVTLTIREERAERLLVLKFIDVVFLEPHAWQLTIQDSCVIYTNIGDGPSGVSITLPDGSSREYQIPSGNRVILCGDVVHIDTRRP